MSCQQVVTSLSFFQFLTNLKQFGRRTPDAQHVILIFSLVGTFILQKLKTELKNL